MSVALGNNLLSSLNGVDVHLGWGVSAPKNRPSEVDGTGSSRISSQASDRVEISAEAESRLEDARVATAQEETADGAAIAELDRSEVAELAELKKRDAEVKAHEQAHLAAAGSLATGGASYSYEKGPDGQLYAVGGEVGIEVSPEADPDATLAKSQRIRAAALAPAQPSGADRAVAAQAASMASAARSEKSAESREEQSSEPTTAQVVAPTAGGHDPFGSQGVGGLFDLHA